mgnify:FL=1
MQISIKSDIKQLTKRLTKIQKKQVPFATALALTKTAQKVKAEEIKTMERVFKKPTRFTLNSLFLKPAKKTQLTARVWVKDKAFKGSAAIDYLGPQIYGGRRENKRLEWLLKYKKLMPKNKFVVPGGAIRRNQYGNVSKAQINKILSNLGAQFDRYQNTPIDKRSQKPYFIASPKSGLHPGIWKKTKQGVQPMFLFVRQPTYKKRFPFFQVANKTSKRYFAEEFNKALQTALRTAR